VDHGFWKPLACGAAELGARFGFCYSVPVVDERSVVRGVGTAYAVGSARKNKGRNAMHAVVRMYSGAGGKTLIDVLEERKKEVEDLIRPVKGFVSYSLFRTADGGASVTVCQDKAGTDESLRSRGNGSRRTRPTPAQVPLPFLRVRSF